MGEGAQTYPRRLGECWFKPSEDTTWPAPREDPPGHLLEFAYSTYCDLLEHPCGLEMLRRARRAWKAVRRAERGP